MFGFNLACVVGSCRAACSQHDMVPLVLLPALIGLCAWLPVAMQFLVPNANRRHKFRRWVDVVDPVDSDLSSSKGMDVQRDSLDHAQPGSFRASGQTWPWCCKRLRNHLFSSGFLVECLHTMDLDLPKKNPAAATSGDGGWESWLLFTRIVGKSLRSAWDRQLRVF